MHDYYVDESILTLNSPDIDNASFTDSIKFRVVGTAPIDYTKAVFDSTVNRHALVVNGSIDTSALKELNSQNSPLYSDFFYNDAKWYDNDSNTRLHPLDMGSYKTYLFASNNYLGVTTADELTEIEGENYEGEFPGKIVKQQILNQSFSTFTQYLPECDYGDIYCKKITEETDDTFIRINTGNGLYYNNLKDIIVSNDLNQTPHLFKYTEISGSNIKSTIGNKYSSGSTYVKFKETEHLLLNLQDRKNSLHKYILPHFNASTDYFKSILDGKKDIFSNETMDNYLLSARGEWRPNVFSFDSPVLPIWEEPTKTDGDLLMTFYGEENHQAIPIGGSVPTQVDHIPEILKSYSEYDLFKSILENGYIKSVDYQGVVTYTYNNGNRL